LRTFPKGVKLPLVARPTKLPEAALEYFREQGRRGGKQSGKARLEKLTPEQRSEVARKAAKARWGKKKVGSSRPLKT
jgi:hypothetical protein